MRKNIFKSVLLLLASFFTSVNGYSQIDLSSSDKFGRINSLMSATADRDLEGVRFFSKNNPTTVNQKNIGGATALNIAARISDFEIAKVLVERDANVNSSDNEGWTSLMRAALSKNKDIVNLLLNNGANASNLNSFGESAIIHAAFSDCNECLFLILERMNHFSDKVTLRQQINDAFVVARNHDNKDAQAILENSLNRVENGYQSKSFEEETSLLNGQNDSSSIVVEQNIPLINKPTGKKFKFQRVEEVKKPTYSEISEDSNNNQVNESIKTILEEADDKKQKLQINQLEPKVSVQPSKKYVFNKVGKETSKFEENEQKKEEEKIESSNTDKEHTEQDQKENEV